MMPALRPKLKSAMLVLALFVAAMFLLPTGTSAHPLDQYVQMTYITVEPTDIVVELYITPGVLIAPDVLAELDANGDEVISEEESYAYIAPMVDALQLTVDGEPVTLTLTSIDMPAYLNIQTGYGEITITTSAALPEGTTGTHTLTFANTNAPTGVKYQVNAFVDADSEVTLGEQIRSDDQESVSLEFAIGNSAISASAGASSGESASNESTNRMLTYLQSPVNSPTALMMVITIPLLLGAVHALTPGHGKTLVAAYLVGSRGTIRQAIALGGIVTFTHTASVIVIGLLALFASNYIMPEVLVPGLEVAAGAMVVVLGFRLVRQRWGLFRRQPAHNDTGHTHSHDHHHDHMHSHDQDLNLHFDLNHDHALVHDHGDGRYHSHALPEEGTSFRGLLTMGISGGLVPCPEALGIMILAVGLNRIVLGLGMIVSFSLGLAAVLIALGIVLVRSRSLVERFSGKSSALTVKLPLISAVIVLVLGFGIVARGLASIVA